MYFVNGKYVWYCVMLCAGALDTKYAMQCFDQWMVTSMLENTTYDAIVINSGLHDVNYSGRYVTVSGLQFGTTRPDLNASMSAEQPARESSLHFVQW